MMKEMGKNDTLNICCRTVRIKKKSWQVGIEEREDDDGVVSRNCKDGMQ